MEYEELKATATNVARFLESIKKYSQIEELTSEILRTFIQKVTIGERPKKHSRNAVLEIKICYRDVGLLDDMPEAECRIRRTEGRKTDHCRSGIKREHGG